MLRRRTPVAALSALAALAVLTGCTGRATGPAAALPTQVTAAAAASVAAHPSTPLPAAQFSGTANGDAFGSGLAALAETKAMSVKPSTTPKPARKRLAGLTIVLDPGHNGANGDYPARLNALVPAGGFLKPCNTTGTETDAGYTEHAFNWDVVNRTEKLLVAEGAKVVLTRHSDTGFGPCVNIRAAIGNAAHADAVIAVHADGAAAGQYGFHVIAPALAPDGGNRAILARSWALALAVHSAFHAATGEAYSTYVSGGLIRRSDLAGLNLSRVPAIFIECANMRNAADADNVTSAAWRQKAAIGIVAGVTAFLHR